MQYALNSGMRYGVVRSVSTSDASDPGSSTAAGYIRNEEEGSLQNNKSDGATDPKLLRIPSTAGQRTPSGGLKLQRRLTESDLQVKLKGKA